MAQKNISSEIVDFFELWGVEEMTGFLEHVMPIFNMFQDKDIIENPATEEDALNVKLIRYVYLMSYIADTYSGKFARIRSEHKLLWRRLEKIAEEVKQDS